MVIEFLAVVCQRSLRAEFAADHSGRNSQAHLLPDREIDFTLVQSKS
jgi:hypothetical protein